MIVIDASVVIKVLTQEVGSELARDRFRLEPDRVAPDWLSTEVASALAKKVRYGGLSEDVAHLYLAALPEIMPDLVSSAEFLDEALRLSVELRHALYDCLYLAIAITGQCVLLTADEKFFSAVMQSAYRDRVELLA